MGEGREHTLHSCRSKEVSLRRLLSRCERDVSDGNAPSAQHMDMLNQQIKEMSVLQGEGSVVCQHLEDLRVRVQNIANTTAPEVKPAYCRKMPRIDYIASPLPSPAMIMASIRTGTPGSSANLGYNNGASKGSSQSRSGFQLRHEHLQDELTEEMVHFASGLKDNSLAIERALKEQSQTLESTEGILERNLGSTKMVSELAKDQYTHSAAGSWMKWILLLVMGLLFTWMVMFIRTFDSKL
mmetsp:Transcript_50236/g.95960  ORF Transcript_50236/g.95960 Transcript_50236/m.95960 type:complete len:240 (-) Transcript_50236:44-763(-)|eukprot:CAMPEP_0114307482 /NCGR_PEP_ID=MMETSP0059-20121206/17491_1 /TAXON_ID=36894 /ORGANISM="Pyramimonas parkeae, Strain CCMP726" /LENGTH=239 /DNA_ID=CAMNT_0001430945 /DNA_START=104 /DNA_END=823 /DNA_ORIENTATION=-